MGQHTHESITTEVISILSEVTGLSEEDLIDELVTNNASFEDMSIDSLNLLDAFFQINHEFGINLPQHEWSKAYTGPNARDANGLRLYTLPSVVAEIQRQLATKPEPFS